MQTITSLQQFIQALAQAQWLGESTSDIAVCLQYATDNSVYQVLPALILFPKSASDLQIIFKTAKQTLFQDLHFSVRGGGTGTNGQSLTDGIVIDCSKYMNHILEVNYTEGWVRVEPGVVLDQLNDFLKSQGYFFPIIISTSSRCTLGGMANTNACGKGSCFYGRTEDYVLSATSVLANGDLIETHKMTLDELKQSECPLCHVIADAANVELDDRYLDLARPLTGYGLVSVFKDKFFNPNAVLVGSEGTLAAFAEIKLKIIKRPAAKQLIVFSYDDFQSALQDGLIIRSVNPEAIETLDGTLLKLAKDDILYADVAPFLGDADKVSALSLVEFVGDNEQTVLQQVDRLLDVIQCHPARSRLAYQVVVDSRDIENLWALRKKSVGLLGRVKGERKPVSGMEDTLVSPRQLPDFIRDYRQLLDDAQLDYGMFGHIDAGCLHVRPALDLSQEADKKRYYSLSLQVAALVKKYNGIMWGEHGKGFRSQFVPETFGAAGFAALCEIKRAFDPRNILNRNKIAVPDGDKRELIALDQPALRGDYNQQIDQHYKDTFNLSVACNGNGACFDYSVKNIMCPSYKVTRDRVHSPKGRATLIREWVRLKSNGKNTGELDQAVYDAMHGCLGCKGCVTQCPVHVNIPDQKAKFLSYYYKSHRWSWRDRLFAYSEKAAALQSVFPSFFNRLTQLSLSKWLLKRYARVIDLPLLSQPKFSASAAHHHIKVYKVKDVLLQAEAGSVVLLQDWITRSYDAALQISFYQLLSRLNIKVFLLERLENGESFSQLGRLDKAKKIAQYSTKALSQIQQAGLQLVGIEPALTLTYDPSLSIRLVQSFLVDYAGEFPQLSQPKKPLLLLMHCNEKSADSQLAAQWIEVFKRFGLKLEVRDVGCCGMAGMYGHELEHVEYSKKLFKMSWQSVCAEDAVVLATGFSCRSQAVRFSNIELIHPVAYLKRSI